MKLIIEITDEYYNECNRWVRQKIANFDQYIIAHGVEYVEPKKGKWIRFKTDNTTIQCPFCTAFVSAFRSRVFMDKIGNLNFCPSCGARMEADND